MKPQMQADVSSEPVRDYPSLEPISNLLELLRRRWSWMTLCRVTAAWAAAVLIDTVLVLLLAGIFQPSDLGRLFLMVVWFSALAAGPVVYMYLLIFRQPSPLALAVLTQKEAKLPHNDLVNALQLADDPFWSSRYVARVISESAQTAMVLDPRQILPASKLHRQLVVSGIGLLAVMLLLVFSHRTLATGFSAMLRPASRQSATINQPGSLSRLTPADLSRLLSVQITARVPRYLEQTPQSLGDNPGPLEIPEGTELEFSATLTERMADLALLTGEMTSIKFEGEESSLRYRTTWQPEADGGYAVAGIYRGLRVRWPMGEKLVWPVKLIRDQAPTVQFSLPADDVELAAGEPIRFVLRAQDDHGLAYVRVRVDNATVFEAKPGKVKFTFEPTWTAPAGAKVGDAMTIWAEATDNRDLPNRGPQTTQTRKVRIRIVSTQTREQTLQATKTALRKILDGEHRSEKPATAPASQPGDSPSMQKLSDLLGKFIDQQRLALRSTQDLSGKPPADFSEKDKAALEQLRQLQEKWDRFLQQAVNDMDKLAKQDFSAAVAQSELVEIQSQVQLAENAMKQNATLMAIKAEQVGLELAKELLHNIERWMSDVPDRLKWDMEQPPAPIDVPLAQLPEELEDIVGDLIEKEEDLYDQIEDETSAWADSLDKGAGWGVMDGPISNYSAKGITGNLLPNKNEIGGRSGEGRTGRSSGEFVEQTAQGKGGRRTPTRLTKDDFQSGQIEDRSPEPAGGATGGGKLSGAGAEGLTGPRPKQMMPNLPALKQKQALLLSKTKMAQWQAQKNNWGNFQLEKAIELMAANQADLERGAYRSVLARRTVLVGSLKNSKALLESKYALDRPEQKLPKTLQAQIQATDPNAIPETLRPVIDKYYQLLAKPETKEKTMP